MMTIEERAFKAYPIDEEFRKGFEELKENGVHNICVDDSFSKERYAYIKACEEYESLPKIRGWVARDKNGAVFFHREKPHRELDCVWRTAWVMHPRPELDHLRLPNALDIQELNWESEPIEVELLIRKV